MKKIVILTLILMIGVVLVAQGNQPRVHQMTERREMMERPRQEMERRNSDMGLGYLERLNLTEQQREQVRNFHHSNELEMIDKRAEIAKLRLQLQEAMQNNNFREAKGLNLQLHQKQGEMAGKGIELQEKIHQILNQEQREQLKQLKRTRGQGGNCDDCEDCK